MIVKIPDVGQGVNYDLSPDELAVGAWNDVTNMRFKDGYAQKFRGLKQVFADTTAPAYFLGHYETATARYWIHAGTARVFADDGNSRLDITPSVFTGAIDDRWNAGVLGGVWVMNNGVNVPQFWGGSGVLAALPGWNANWRANVIVPFKSYLVALNVQRQKYPVTITSITFVTTTATLTTTSPHNLQTGDSITVAGATPTQYNGTFTITRTGANTFTYTMGGTPAGVASPVGSYTVNTTTRLSSLVKWSHSAVPGTLPDSWNETDVTRDAGEQDLAETTDALVDALPLGDSLILYKERSMYSMTFIGQPFIWRFQRIPGSVGMLSKGCGVATPAGHVVLTAGDVVLFDGQQAQSIASGQVRRFIFNNIDSLNFKKAFVVKNLKDNEVLICFPTSGSTTCDKAAVWNWQTKTWGMRDLPSVTYGAEGQLSAAAADIWSTDTDTWADEISSWNEDELEPNSDRLMLCTTAKIAAFDVGVKDLGAVMPSKLERVGMSFDEPSGVKLFRGVWPRIDAPSGTVVNISIGASMNPDSLPIFTNPVPFTVGQDVKVDAFAQGRYLAMRIESDGVYRVRSVNLDIVPTGTY